MCTMNSPAAVAVTRVKKITYIYTGPNIIYLLIYNLYGDVTLNLDTFTYI